MAKINNVDVGALTQLAEQAKIDRAKAKRVQRIEGEWLLGDGEPQFRAEVSFEGGKVVMEADQPKNLGGGGSRPGPLHYCFFGLLACYTASFASMASQMGIRLKRLAARVESDLNFSRVLGLSSEPIIEEVRIILQVESDATREKLEEAERLAYERCPAVFALTQPVRLRTVLQ